ncbi:E3 ubiquitin-protein ligase TRIM22-like [Mytilus edulis]|uniref:E3 ubiquitin-protein ligase TRIM22-like n=1 Tax=Mytilus edulis TaxID=6550 RepID=UPI0039F088C0
MALNKPVPCGPCKFDDFTIDAGSWCTNCEEGLCEDCENVHRKIKLLRNHKVISIEDYRKIENVSISLICEHHGENFEWFCQNHDKLLCMVCVTSNHKSCSGVISISAASKNAKQSTALSDLEKEIQGTLLNVQEFTKNRESATKEIDKQELMVKNIVFETRTKINSYLDKLQEKLLLKLGSISDNCKSKNKEFLQKLESKTEMLTKLMEQTLHLKQLSSDIQVFLGTRQVNKRIVSEIKSLKTEIGTTKDYELKVDIHSLIENFSKKVEDFGQIKVLESCTELEFRDYKIDQTKIETKVPTSGILSDMKLQLIKTFQMKRETDYVIDVRGCVILPNGNLLMTNYSKQNQLVEYKYTGEHMRDIQVSALPFFIAVIDPNRIAVTYGDTAKFLEIRNTHSFRAEKEIRLPSKGYGVSHEDGRLYVKSGNSTIQVMDLSGKQLETLKLSSDSVLNITTSRDKIFYTDYKKNIVHCCRLNGEELWQVKRESVSHPYGVTVDHDRNVYVVGLVSNNLTIIQQDGKDSKTLLTESDGLFYPQAVDFDMDKRTLLICNKGGKVSMYKVV